MTRRDVLRSAAAATLTEAPMRFLRYETVSLAGPRAVTYRLRGRADAVVIRHGTRDVDRLMEWFGPRSRGVEAVIETALASAGASPRIVDLGAGGGIAALALLSRRPTARLISVEPDPINLVILRRTIAANPHLGEWEALAGATASGGYLRGPGYARRVAPDASEDERHECADAVDAFSLLRDATVARINLGGAEWSLLGDERFASAAPKVVVLEAHQRRCPGGDPIAEAGRVLSQLGYRMTAVRGRGRPNDVLWAWQSA